MTHFLKPYERSWFMLGSKSTPMHLGALLIFKLPARGAKSYISNLITMLRAQNTVVAPWNYTLVKGLRPSWSETAEVDLDYHVRHIALPEPGGERELGGLVSRLHSHTLDMQRPLWECHLIEGLSDGRFALFIKMHHSLTDTSGFIRLLTSWLSPSKSGQLSAAPWATPSAADSNHDSWTQPLIENALNPKQALQSGLAMGGLSPVCCAAVQDQGLSVRIKRHVRRSMLKLGRHDAWQHSNTPSRACRPWQRRVPVPLKASFYTSAPQRCGDFLKSITRYLKRH